MIELGNFRIVQIDRYNMTFEEYREVENIKTKEKSMKWIKTGGYYGNLGHCLKALKDYVISNSIQNKDYDLESICKFIDELNNCYVKCIIKVENEND